MTTESKILYLAKTFKNDYLFNYIIKNRDLYRKLRADTSFWQAIDFKSEYNTKVVVNLVGQSNKSLILYINANLIMYSNDHLSMYSFDNKLHNIPEVECYVYAN